MRIENLTPHPIYLLDENGKIIREWDRGTTISRIQERKSGMQEMIEDNETSLSIPIQEIAEEKIENLPPKKQGVLLIVSMVIAMKVKRDDLIVPHVVRNAENKIVGCKGFLRITAALPATRAKEKKNEQRRKK